MIFMQFIKEKIIWDEKKSNGYYIKFMFGMSLECIFPNNKMQIYCLRFKIALIHLKGPLMPILKFGILLGHTVKFRF